VAAGWDRPIVSTPLPHQARSILKTPTPPNWIQLLFDEWSNAPIILIFSALWPLLVLFGYIPAFGVWAWFWPAYDWSLSFEFLRTAAVKLSITIWTFKPTLYVVYVDLLVTLVFAGLSIILACGNISLALSTSKLLFLHWIPFVPTDFSQIPVLQIRSYFRKFCVITSIISAVMAILLRIRFRLDAPKYLHPVLTFRKKSDENDENNGGFNLADEVLKKIDSNLLSVPLSPMTPSVSQPNSPTVRRQLSPSSSEYGTFPDSVTTTRSGPGSGYLTKSEDRKNK